MAVGSYGIVRPADVSPDDVEILYHYATDRVSTTAVTLKKLTSNQVLTPILHTGTTTTDTAAVGTEILGGLYSLKLPASEFNKKGIYTVYLRPAEIRTTISDCGILSALPNVKGIVIDINQVPTAFRNKFTNQGLVGYRIEYLNQDGTKIPNFYRIVTSSFFCEPVVTEQVNSSQKSIRYRYVDGGSDLVFCTLSPSSSPTNKPNATPFIGQPNQNIIVTNTFFNPITIDIQMADYDLDTLAIALYGNQTKSIEDGIYTLYDSIGNIYKQYNLFEVRDNFNNLLYEVRQDRNNNIDFSKNFTNIIS
jgi:hypothetical protein